MEKILKKTYLVENGIDYNELCYEYCSDRMLDKDEEDGGKAFSGLTYELDEFGNVLYYGKYKNGFEEGECVYFYPNGNIERRACMKRGRVFGEDITYFEDGRLKSVSYSEYGVELTRKEWDESNNLIVNKEKPTQSDIELRDSGKEWHKKVTGEKSNG